MSTRTKAPGLSPDPPSTATVTLTVPVVGIDSRRDALDDRARRGAGGVGSQSHLLPGPEPGDVALGDVDVGVERLEIGEIVDRRAVGDGGADVEVAGHDDAGDRRPDDGARELEFGELEGVGRIFGVATACFELVDAHQPAVVQTCQPFVVSASSLFRRASAGGGDLLLVVLEIGERLLGPDPIALFDDETTYDSTGAGDDRRLPVGAEGC